MSSSTTPQLVTSPSSYAEQAGYIRPSDEELIAASTITDKKVQPNPKKKRKTAVNAKTRAVPSAAGSGAASLATPLPLPTSFPAPLVLPSDELAFDPEYPPQSITEWLDDPDRNAVTRKRNIIYVAPPPLVDSKGETISSQVRAWMKPTVKAGKGSGVEKGGVMPGTVNSPEVEDVLDYLRNFYVGMEVRLLEGELAFTDWEEQDEQENPPQQHPAKGKNRKKTAKPSSSRSQPPPPIGIRTSTEVIRITTRLPPKTTSALYPAQLNLNDLLDAAIDILPADAYALLLLTHHDLYEDDEDDFCVGRAYGGSRVAVVSTARYHPALDRTQGVLREEAWPLSHGMHTVQRACGVLKKMKPPTSYPLDLSTPLHAAYTTTYNLDSSPENPEGLTNLWLSRVCRTASHELGHCFGIDHCVYYACVMQGSADLCEDQRQPGYLCPIDLGKVLLAIGGKERQWLEGMSKFCADRRWEQVVYFKALGAWCDARLRELDASRVAS